MAAVDHAGKLVDSQSGADRSAAVGDLRRTLKRRPELGPVVTSAISETWNVWGWVPDDNPRTMASRSS